MVNPTRTLMRNGRRAMFGPCECCGAKIYVAGSWDADSAPIPGNTAGTLPAAAEPPACAPPAAAEPPACASPATAEPPVCAPPAVGAHRRPMRRDSAQAVAGLTHFLQNG